MYELLKLYTRDLGRGWLLFPLEKTGYARRELRRRRRHTPQRWHGRYHTRLQLSSHVIQFRLESLDRLRLFRDD